MYIVLLKSKRQIRLKLLACVQICRHERDHHEKKAELALLTSNGSFCQFTTSSGDEPDVLLNQEQESKAAGDQLCR